jgi:hypothetical protein
MNVLNLEEDLDALGLSSNYNGFGSSMKRKGQKKSKNIHLNEITHILIYFFIV